MNESLLFCLDGRTELADAILLNSDNCVKLGELRKQQFSDGEISIDFLTSVRGKHVYLLSSPHSSDEIIKLILGINAAKLSGAKHITIILPYFPYGRSDKKDYSRGSIGAKVMAQMFEECGATSVITFDLHADQIQGFFNIPVVHIEGKYVFNDYIKSIATEDTILASPDAGGVKRVKRMCDMVNKKHSLGLTYIIMDKTRNKPNEVEKITIIGDVKGKDVIIIDDMVDTFGSAEKAIECIMNNGAKSVRMIASHGILSGMALERISDSSLIELIVSDSLNRPDLPIEQLSKIHKKIKGNAKIKTLSVAKHIGLAIIAITNNSSYENLIEL